MAKLDVEGDLHEMMRQRDRFVNYRVTREQAASSSARLIPSLLVHNKSVDKKFVDRALRPRQRLLRGVPRRHHGLHLGLLQGQERHPGGGAAPQDPPRRREAPAQEGRAAPRHRLRLGHPGGTRPPRPLRRRRHRRDHLQEPARVRRPSASRSAGSRTRPASSPSTTATSPSRVRQDLLPGDGRARRASRTSRAS